MYTVFEMSKDFRPNGRQGDIVWTHGAACEDLLHLVGIASFQYSNIRG